jgi:hypothetical protein
MYRRCPLQSLIRKALFNHNALASNTNTYALIWVLPEANLAAIVCTNTGEKQAFPARDEMISHVISSYPAAKTVKQDDESPADLGKIDPERLVGRYQLLPNFIFGSSMVAQNERHSHSHYFRDVPQSKSVLPS